MLHHCMLHGCILHAVWVQIPCCTGACCALHGCTLLAVWVHASSTTLLSPCTGFSAARVPQDLDAVVIGSGIGGLAAACILAKVGKRVLVLEQHDQAGGCCHTFQEQGSEFDVGKEQRALVVRARCDRAHNLQRIGCAKCARSTCGVGAGRVCVVHAVFARGVHACSVHECVMYAACTPSACSTCVCMQRACHVHTVCVRACSVHAVYVHAVQA